VPLAVPMFGNSRAAQDKPKSPAGSSRPGLFGRLKSGISSPLGRRGRKASVVPGAEERAAAAQRKLKESEARRRAEEAELALQREKEKAPLSRRQLQEQFEENLRTSLLGVARKSKNKDINWEEDLPLEEWHSLKLNAKMRVLEIDLCVSDLRVDLSDFGVVFGPMLQVVSLGWNSKLKGDIQCFGNCVNLTYVNLYSTAVDGDIEVFGNCPNLKVLSLARSGVSGKLISLGKCYELQQVYLKDTLVSGDKERFLSRCPGCMLSGPD